MTTARLAVWIALALFCLPAQAERTDRDAPTNIEADKLQYDEGKQTSVFTGNVVLTKGSILIRGERLVLRQLSDNMQTAVVTGRRATFQQKREGIDQLINGLANEIHYDSRDEIVRLIGEALIKRLECDVATDEITGGVIVYNARTEQFDVDGKAPGERSGRVRIVINPRSDTRSPPAAVPGQKCATPPPVSLKPAVRLATGRPRDGASR
ncbi:MAG: lipopolysaccharide transport periplasmic protein LptA [Lautropia sp.]